jgi:hypothetical protein
MKILGQESPRVAILGAGGMGKTSLAQAVLHHPTTSTKFEQRFFISAESATTSVELAALIGLYVGLKPGRDLTQPVVQYFLNTPPCLLVLDNMETPWEPVQTRGGVEEFLSLLTDILQLALIVSYYHCSQFQRIIFGRSQCEEQRGQPKSTGLIHFCCLSSPCPMMPPDKLSWKSQMNLMKARR